MQVILQGSLRHFPPGELLSFVMRCTESGTLDLENGGRRIRILFKEQKIVWAESSAPGEPGEAVIEALGWSAGAFTLLDSIALPENVQPVALDLQPLIDEATRRAERAGFSDSTLYHVVDDPALQQQVSLTANQFKLLFRVAAGRTFKDLLAELGVPREELEERLKRLDQLGLIKPAQEDGVVVDATAPQKKISGRRRTLVGSLTPDGAPDSVWPLLDSEYGIGRAPANAIAIADSSVSSNHGRIVRTPEGFVLEDLQSSNGTFVNGEPVTEKRLLVDGDLIRIGKVILTFNVARESKPGEDTQGEVRMPANP